MKKILLSLLIFCSVILQAQIQIPQVVGLTSALNSKVDKATGKSLVADSSIIKLNGIQSGAQVNILEGVQRNGANLTITGKKVNVIVPTTPSEVGAEPANINIQSHISSTSNPHSVTKAQVGLGNVDNTSDVNKPISSATQTALDGKQLIGTYATGNGTANGTNTGDETLTSIKTKLGAATSVSDGYLKYQDWSIFNSKEPAITKNSGFNLPLGSTPGTVLEGRTFGTAANSAVGDFIQNQNLSPQSSNAWLTGTIKSNSSISVIKDGSNTVGGGSFVGISNSSDSKQSIIQLNADSGLDYWFYNGSSFNKSATLSNDGYFNAVSGYKLNGNNLFNSITSNATPLWDGSKFINSSLSGYQSYPALYLPIYPAPFLTNSVITGNYTGTGSPNKSLIITDAANRPVALFDNSGRLDLKDYSGHGGLAVLYNMAEPVTDQLIGHYAWASRNSAGHLATTNLIKAVLTNTSETSMSSQLRIDYMHNCNTAGIYAEPNQGISIDGNGFTLPNIPFISEVGDQRFAGAISVTGKIKSNHDIAVVKDGSDAIAQGAYLNLSNTSDSKQVLLQLNGSGGIDYWFNDGISFNKVSSMSNSGVVTASSFSGNGSNLTGIQLPITLTTNGTSGAATFSGNVLNVPNYAASGGVNQTQTAVNGSTGGNMVCSMPFQTGSYKKVMIRFSSLSGNASYSYPTVFTTQPSISSIYQQVGTPGTYTTGGAGASAFTITGASGLSGWIIIEGY